MSHVRLLYSFYIPPTLYLHEKFTFMVGLWLTGSKMMCFPNLTHGAKPWRLFRGFCLAPMRCNNSGKCHVLFSFFSKWHYVSNIFDCFVSWLKQILHSYFESVSNKLSRSSLNRNQQNSTTCVVDLHRMQFAILFSCFKTIFFFILTNPSDNFSFVLVLFLLWKGKTKTIYHYHWLFDVFCRCK